jgi:hypothetical protein
LVILAVVEETAAISSDLKSSFIFRKNMEVENTSDSEGFEVEIIKGKYEMNVRVIKIG